MPFNNLKNRMGRELPEDIESRNNLLAEYRSQLEKEDLPLQEPEIDPVGTLVTAGLSGAGPAILQAAEGGVKKMGRRALSDKLRQERMLQNDANFVKTRSAMGKTLDPELAEKMSEYKQTAPTQQEVNYIKGGNPELQDQAIQPILTGEEYKAKLADILAQRELARKMRGQ